MIVICWSGCLFITVIVEYEIDREDTYESQHILFSITLWWFLARQIQVLLKK